MFILELYSKSSSSKAQTQVGIQLDNNQQILSSLLITHFTTRIYEGMLQFVCFSSRMFVYKFVVFPLSD